LNILYLVQCGLLRTPVLYLSRYILQHRLEYYRFLREVTENQRWEPWMLFVLFAVEETARWTSARINAIYELHQYTGRHIRERLPGIYSRELVDVLFIQPYVRIEVLVEAGIGQRQTAASYLKRLVDSGVLQELKVGREKLFLHTKFFDLLRQESEEFLPYGEG
ncbi:MAG: Fic family protein, partial [Candidatus Hydrogenedentes bacterium]|nr:Fic family protein [Candidatus Hydrogenedentota bacterium]